MGYESNGNGNDDVNKAFEELRNRDVPICHTAYSRETIEAFRSSFSAPANKVDFGRIIELKVEDPNGKESPKTSRVIFVKELPKTRAKTPTVMDCEFLSRDSSIGRHIKGMTLGESRRFQDDGRREMVLSIDKIEFLPDDVILKILEFPTTCFKGCDSEAVEAFRSSFKAPTNRVDFGRIVELTVGDLANEPERLKILYVKEVVSKAPCPPNCMYISERSKIGQSIMGLDSGRSNEFFDNDGRRTIVLVEKVEPLPEAVVQEILKDL